MNFLSRRLLTRQTPPITYTGEEAAGRVRGSQVPATQFDGAEDRAVGDDELPRGRRRLRPRSASSSARRASATSRPSASAVVPLWNNRSLPGSRIAIARASRPMGRSPRPTPASNDASSIRPSRADRPLAPVRPALETSFSPLWSPFLDRVFSRSGRGWWNTVQRKLLHYHLCPAGILSV